MNIENPYSTELEAWLINAQSLPKRYFEGFVIIDGIDGKKSDPIREVSLVTASGGRPYPQHIHKKSDALFIISTVRGNIWYCSGMEKISLKAGQIIEVPRGTPHGFEIHNDSELTYISIQSPPIRNNQTGEEDFMEFDL